MPGGSGWLISCVTASPFVSDRPPILVPLVETQLDAPVRVLDQPAPEPAIALGDDRRFLPHAHAVHHLRALVLPPLRHLPEAVLLAGLVHAGTLVLLVQARRAEVVVPLGQPL